MRAIELSEVEVREVRGLRRDLGVSSPDLAGLYTVPLAAVQRALGEPVGPDDGTFVRPLDPDPATAEAVLRWLGARR